MSEAIEVVIGETKNLAAAHSQVVAELSHAWDEWNSHNVAPLWPGSPTEDPTAPVFPAPAKAKKQDFTRAARFRRR